MKLLVLSCCAPCSCGALKRLAENGVEVTVLFYNPNIFPQEEYTKRLAEQERLCRGLGVKLVELPYAHDVWLKHVRGLESEPERGRRCSVCFYMQPLQLFLHHFSTFYRYAVLSLFQPDL